jgi:hypothetical protein
MFSWALIALEAPGGMSSTILPFLRMFDPEGIVGHDDGFR